MNFFYKDLLLPLLTSDFPLTSEKFYMILKPQIIHWNISISSNTDKVGKNKPQIPDLDFCILLLGKPGRNYLNTFLGRVKFWNIQFLNQGRDYYPTIWLILVFFSTSGEGLNLIFGEHNRNKYFLIPYIFYGLNFCKFKTWNFLSHQMN